MQRAHKVALAPNNVQATYLAKACGTARFAYNWALATWQTWHEHAKVHLGQVKPTQLRLRRFLNEVKRDQFPWMMEVTKCAPQEAIIDLGKGFDAFFAGKGRYPRFKRKGVHDSFRVSPGQYVINGNQIRLPRIGWIRMRECLRWPDARTLSVTISRHRGRWMAAILCDLPDPESPVVLLEGSVGVDVGVDGYWVSNGQCLMVPRAYRNARKRLRRAQQRVGRARKGSNNYRKAQARVALVHGQIRDVRQDWLHKTTTYLASTYALIGIEDLNVKGMVAKPKPKPDPDRPGRYLPNGRGAQSGRATSILDAGFGEFHRQLGYKTLQHGSLLSVCDRWYPSTKLCSACGVKTKQPLPLSVRGWTCENCGTTHHRDHNAAINVENNAVSSTVSAQQRVLASVPTTTQHGPRSKPLDEAGITASNRTI